jgi:phosphoribosyl 1,2-cyclic phosphodiesterase
VEGRAVKVWMLGSGSRGNAMLLETGEWRVLVDAGFGPRALGERLACVGVEPRSIAAVVVTHEHSDHVSGVRSAAKRWGWSVFATAGTRMHTPELAKTPVTIIRRGAEFNIGDLEFRAVAAPHDAAEPIALIATDRPSGARVGIAYDLGHAPETLRRALQDLDLLVLEANYDEEMLRTGPYPRTVQNRIAGRNGHLSNRAAAELAGRCVSPSLTNIVLAHLSENCNTPRLALTAVGHVLRKARFRGRLTAANQDGVCGPFGGGARRVSVQLDLL